MTCANKAFIDVFAVSYGMKRYVSVSEVVWETHCVAYPLQAEEHVHHG